MKLSIVCVLVIVFACVSAQDAQSQNEQPGMFSKMYKTFLFPIDFLEKTGAKFAAKFDNMLHKKPGFLPAPPKPAQPATTPAPTTTKASG